MPYSDLGSRLVAGATVFEKTNITSPWNYILVGKTDFKQMIVV